jgi:hypothetical protein
VLDVVRTWFLVDVFVLAAAGVQCYVLSARTDRWFAWTVAPALSAAVLGAGYFGSMVMVVEARRATRWVDARVVLVSTFVFSTLTLLVTLLHLDKFHLDHGTATGRLAAVAWLVVYGFVPPFVLWLLVRQRRAPGGEPPRTGTPLRPWAIATLGVEGSALLVVGAVLFVRGKDADFWAWRLSDLTAQAISAWVLALGVMLLLCAWEREVSRARPALHSVATAAVLWVLAMVRFHDTVRWHLAGAVTVAVPVLLLATIVAALAPAARGERAAQPVGR